MIRDDFPVPESDPFYTTYRTFKFVPNVVRGTRSDILNSVLAGFCIRKQTCRFDLYSFCSVWYWKHFGNSVCPIPHSLSSFFDYCS